MIIIITIIMKGVILKGILLGIFITVSSQSIIAGTTTVRRLK